MDIVVAPQSLSPPPPFFFSSYNKHMKVNKVHVALLVAYHTYSIGYL